MVKSQMGAMAYTNFIKDYCSYLYNLLQTFIIYKNKLLKMPVASAVSFSIQFIFLI
jgi:hypothetical protein